MNEMLSLSRNTKDLERLKAKYVEASRRALTAVRDDGIDSANFIQANREALELKRKIAEADSKLAKSF
jgi:hypothetical protein